MLSFVASKTLTESCELW